LLSGRKYWKKEQRKEKKTSWDDMRTISFKPRTAKSRVRGAWSRRRTENIKKACGGERAGETNAIVEIQLQCAKASKTLAEEGTILFELLLQSVQ